MNSTRFSTAALATMLVASLGFTLLVAFSLSQSDQRGAHFWISLGVLSFAQMLAFGHAIFSNAAEENPHPVPSIFGMGVALAVYIAASVGGCLIFWLIFPVSLTWYIIFHSGCLLLLVLLGGASLMFLRSSGRMETSERGGRFTFARLRAVAADCVHEASALRGAQASGELVLLLRQLEEMVRFSDPITPAALAHEDAQLGTALQELHGRIRDCGSQPLEQTGLALADDIRRVMHQLKHRNQLVAAAK